MTIIKWAENEAKILNELPKWSARFSLLIGAPSGFGIAFNVPTWLGIHTSSGISSALLGLACFAAGLWLMFVISGGIARLLKATSARDQGE